jgi:hypothetical protein
MPGYLERSIGALEANPDVDWVFSPCRKVDLTTGVELEPSTFLRRGRPRRFMSLRAELRPGGLHVITDPRVLEFQLQQGMTSGPQNSVFRRRVFDRRRFIEEVKVVEDQVLTICALADRRRFAYFLEPMVIYHVHDDNWSFAGGKERPPERFIEVFGKFVQVLDRLRQELPLTAREARAFRRRMAAECFWQFGYNGLWRAGRRQEAVAAFARSLRLWPWGWSRWRTFVLAKLRMRFGIAS